MHTYETHHFENIVESRNPYNVVSKVAAKDFNRLKNMQSMRLLIILIIKFLILISSTRQRLSLFVMELTFF